jgi:hypothetical protein
MAFHPEGARTGKARELKELRVREGQAHAALVYADSACVGWCQFGSPDELPRIKLKRAYLEGLEALPEWRITCFLGGGMVESYPQGVEGQSVSGSFLYNGTVSMFEQHGFHRVRRLGKNHWVVAKKVRNESSKSTG